MKFLLPVLLAAPAVMGRACKAPQPSADAVAPVYSVPKDASIVPKPVADSVPVYTTLATHVAASSKPTEVAVKPQAVSKVQAVSKTKSQTKSKSKPKAKSQTAAKSQSKALGNGASVSGSSTFYGGNLSGGNCMFTTYTLPAGILGTAFSGQKWDNGANCGACIEVTGPSGTVKAMIVDKCPECDPGHLDLFPDAFKAVGGTNGIVKTSYKFVECGITTPLVLHNKSGTSANWFSIQVVNANEPVKSVEVSVDGGKTWKTTERKDYNFFENPAGFGKESVDVKITSSTGKTVIVNKVGVTADAQYKAKSNF
ncbi:RlpA-like double-psi beta-barrel-protein domain-containing protein-containing protein [Fusarium venenatum]|uniref:RlpA-like double-psi beta-barrel-protein domain-containing protein-containing protein n=1 Tax=Fusarium venenatum TaxID=56646 RepID=UPI001D3414A4|nr:RlpA-like double-psi beta-barrel-protein domain-containing protein-containing protein [Fusarium venenatum]